VASKREHAQILPEANQLTDLRWDVQQNPALRELLDHIAEELAREYVRLMTTARRGKPK
jgi:hypothetical protein